MEISPALGIGDLLTWKIFCSNNNINIKKISINNEIIQTYKNNPDNYIAFIKYFISALFLNVEIEIKNNISIQYPPHTLNITNTYIYDLYNFSYNTTNDINDKYIVFHTKVRFDGYMNNFLNNDINILRNFINNFKTKYTIVLIGEKNEVEQNIETRVHNIQSLYDIYCKLKENNNVIDLTSNSSIYSGTIPQDFEYILHIINKADCNITIGCSGNVNMAKSFSKNTLCYIGPIYNNIIGLKIYNKNSFYYDINNFVNTIQGKYSN